MRVLAGAIFRSFASDRSSLLFTFLAPIAFFAMFALFFSHLDRPDGMHFRVALVRLIDTPDARRMSAAILARPHGRLAVTEVDAAPRDADAVVTVLTDFTAARPALRIESRSALPGVADALHELVAAAALSEFSVGAPQISIEDRSVGGSLMRASAAGIPALFVLFSLSGIVARGLADEERGFGERLRSLGITRRKALLARGSVLVLIGSLQMVTCFAAAWITFGITPRAPVALLACALLGAAAAAGFVLALAALCRTRARFAVVAPVATLVFGGLGGSMIPIELLPPVLAWPSKWLFTGWTITASRAALEGAADLPAMAALAASAAGFLVVAVLLGKRTGT